MKKLLLFLILAVSSYARGLLSGNCELGGQRVTIQGAQSSTYVQASYPACTITVYVIGSGSPATIYSTASGTPLINPFVANPDGSYTFFADDANYEIHISGLAILNPFIRYGTIGGGTATNSSTTPTSNFLPKAYNTAMIDIGWLPRTGTGASVATSTGSLTTGNVVSLDSNGNYIASGTALANLILSTGSYANPTWITSLAYSKITGVLVNEANGGTGANNTTGAAGHYLRSNGTHYVDNSIQAGDVPTLNQNTSGNAATATALASTPTQCSGGTPVSTGIAANGNANCTSSSGSVTATLIKNAQFISDTSGSSTAYAGSAVNCPGSLVSWQIYAFVPNQTNSTTTPTLNPCTFGALTIVHMDNSALLVSELDASGATICIGVYNGTNFRLFDGTCQVGDGFTTQQHINPANVPAPAANSLSFFYDSTNSDHASLKNSSNAVTDLQAGGASPVVDYQGVTGNIACSTGVAVTVYSTTVSSIPLKGFLRIKFQFLAGANGTKLEIYVDSTVIATPYDGLATQTLLTDLNYGNTTAQSTQQTAYTLNRFFSGDVFPVSDLPSNVDSVTGVVTSTVDWTTSHTLALKQTCNTGTNGIGKNWSVSLQ